MKHKYNILKSLKLASLALIAIPLVACQTSAPSDPGTAVMCDKCKTVWVNRPITNSVGKGGPVVTAYHDVAVMECPDCESAIATFFKTGALKHHCNHCGGTMRHCEAQTPAGSHTMGSKPGYPMSNAAMAGQN